MRGNRKSQSSNGSSSSPFGRCAHTVGHSKQNTIHRWCVGAIISGVAALLSLLGGFGNILCRALVFGFGSIWAIVGGIILGVGLIVAGIGYMGIKRNYGVGTGTAGFAFSIVACVFVFVNVAFGIIGLSYRYPYGYFPGYYYNPWYIIYIISAFITLILFGVMQILWGIAHINSRYFFNIGSDILQMNLIYMISNVEFA